MAKEPSIRITIVKKWDMRELYHKPIDGVTPITDPVCGYFAEGQEFTIDFQKDDPLMPKGFCSGAWHDMFRWITALRHGGDFHWIEEEGTILVCCTDALRPVVFKLERLD